MCDPSLLMAGGLVEQLGDPLGTRKRRDDARSEDQQNRWAREDAVRDATFAHEKEIAGMNRSGLTVPKPGTGTTGTTGGHQGGARSSPGGKTNRAY